MKSQVIVEPDRAFDIRRACLSLFTQLKPRVVASSVPPQPVPVTR